MSPRRTDAGLVAHRVEELKRSQRKLARARDGTILDLEHLSDDLLGWAELVPASRVTFEAAAEAARIEAERRVEAALAGGPS